MFSLKNVFFKKYHTYILKQQRIINIHEGFLMPRKVYPALEIVFVFILFFEKHKTTSFFIQVSLLKSSTCKVFKVKKEFFKAVRLKKKYFSGKNVFLKQSNKNIKLSYFYYLTFLLFKVSIANIKWKQNILILNFVYLRASKEYLCSFILNLI